MMVKLPFGTHHEFSMRRDNLRLVCPAGVHNYRRLTKEMASVGLLEGFEEMILTNGCTKCLEILPTKERKRGRFGIWLLAF